MELFQWFTWLIYPYTVAAILAMGIVWQYDTSHAFEEMERKSSKVLTGIVKVLWMLTSFTGVGIIALYRNSDELQNLFGWLKSFLHFNPNMDLLEHASLLSQIHLFLLFTFLLFFSFTKYVPMLFKPIRILIELFKQKRANAR